jgi:hypothetical protein
VTASTLIVPASTGTHEAGSLWDEATSWRQVSQGVGHVNQTIAGVPGRDVTCQEEIDLAMADRRYHQQGQPATAYSPFPWLNARRRRTSLLCTVISVVRPPVLPVPCLNFNAGAHAANSVYSEFMLCRPLSHARPAGRSRGLPRDEAVMAGGARRPTSATRAGPPTRPPTRRPSSYWSKVGNAGYTSTMTSASHSMPRRAYRRDGIASRERTSPRGDDRVLADP